jgi:apyrase
MAIHQPSVEEKNIAMRFGVFFIAVFLLLSTVLYPAQVPRNDIVKSSPYYLLIIDAGSSGSRLYVYKIKPYMYDDIPEIVQINTKKVEPGISETGTDKLDVLIEVANQEVPEEIRKKTKLYVLATAGMRLLNKFKQQKILQDVTRYLENNSTFAIQEATVISGKYEGLYAWLAVNYLDDCFDPCSEREGLIEMGGASTQIAFLPVIELRENMVKRTIRGKCYSIYSKSYLHLGQDSVKRELKENKSCFPVKDNGEVDRSRKSSGNFGHCVQYIMKRFNILCRQTKNVNNYCILKYDGDYEPKVAGYFFATSSFYYIFNGLGMPQRITLDKLECQGKQWCDKDEKEWEKLKQSNSEREFKFMRDYCFQAAYFWSLLKYGYSFGDYNARILSETGDVSWTLGAALDLAMDNNNKPEEYNGNN